MSESSRLTVSIIVNVPWAMNQSELTFPVDDLPERPTVEQVKEAAREEFFENFNYAIQVKYKDGKDVSKKFEE